MIIRESVPLSSLTTFKIGGNARYVIDCERGDEAADALAFAAQHGLPWYVLGQGSNLLAPDAGYEGVVIRLSSAEFIVEDEGASSLVIADAGMAWDALVALASSRGLWGIENLAGIPGTAGAAPVQNIGAYGAELADSLAWVEAFDTKAGQMTRLEKEACAFGYRDSRFKRSPDLIIVRIALRLMKSGSPKTSYADLARLTATGEPLDTPENIAKAVRGIRAKKFPDLSREGTAGSFFKNPIITDEAYAALKEKYPELPGFSADGGMKVSIAWILDKVLGLRGFVQGKARLFEAQPLVIVADAAARAEDVDALANEVAKRMHDATGIALEREVRELR